MVDSAVTLSIGTELDLSGLQRDFAALKNQKFNFDFDADKIGRSFREANRQMQLKPRVDLSELHELNRLLDVKLNHVKKVQRYFNANPLRLSTKLDDPVFKIPTGTKSKDQSFSKESINSGNNRVLEQLKQINETLEEIRKNTGADIARGFKQEIGAQIFDQSFVKGAIEVGASSVKSAFKGTGKVIADSFIPKKVQSFFSVDRKTSKSEGLPISDLLNSLVIFTDAVESSAKGVQYGAKSSVEFGKALSKLGGLFNFDVSGVVLLNKTANSVARSMTDVIQKTSAFKSGLSDVITLGNNLNKLPLLLLIRSLDSLAKKSNIAGLNLESITRKGTTAVSFIEALITVLKANTDSFQDLKSQATSTKESFKTVSEIADKLKQPFESIAKQVEKISDRVDNLDSLLTNLSVSIEKIVSLAKDLDTLQKVEIPFSPQAEMEPVEVATEDFAQAQEAIQSVAIEFAESVAKASDSLEILEDALSSLQSVGEIDVSVAMEDLRKTLTALNLDASKQRKKGEYAPDLRMVGQQLGVKTRNPATQKAFKKQELVDFIAENFQAKDIQKALETVQVKLPDIDPKALEDLSRWYDDIASKLKDIDNKPIEDQATIIEALQLAMQKAAKAIEYFEKSFTLGKESNQVLQGRKAAFHSLWKSTEKIKSSWKNTTDFVAGQIQDLEQISDDEGYKIQKNVSEGSPGITVEIRKNWEKTIDFVASQIQELTQKAKAEGMAVKEGMAAGLDESAISGLQQQFRETLKTIEQLKQSVPGLKELGIAIEEIETAISGMSAEELKAEAEEIKQVVEQIGLKITETSGKLKSIVIPQPTTTAPSATKSVQSESEAQTMGVKAGNLRIIRKSWEGFRTIVKEITEDIQDITRGFVKDFDDLFKDFQWYQSLKEELQRAKIIIASSFDVALDAALETPIGQKVGGFVLEMANAFKEKVVPVATAISNGLKAAIAATTGIFDGLIDGFVETFKGDAFKKVASQIGEGLSTVLGKVGGVSAEQFYERFREGTSKLVQQISNTIFTGLSSAIEAMPQVLNALKTTFEGAQGFVTNFFDNFKANIIGIASFLAQAFVLTKLTQGMRALGQASFRTALEVEQLTRSLSFSSAEGGVTTLDMIKQKAEELSLSFIEAAQGYSQLAASTLGTSLESQTEDIFTGVSTAIAARGLGKEQQSRAFLAISQIASKGRVSLEELNGQLGEALPGALQTASRALGVTSAELIKLVSTGQVTADEFLPKFADQLALEAGSSVAAAANTATAQLVKFENRLTNIRAELGKGILTPLAAVLPIVNGALKLLSDNMTLVLGVVTSISAVMAFNLAKALILVAAQFKLVNLALATFGITLEQQVNAVTGKTTVKVIGLQGAIAGLGNAFKMMALQAAPLLILATVVSRIQAATKPLNEDIAKTNKEFVTAINNAKRLRSERERKSEQGGQQTPTGDYQIFGELYRRKAQQQMLGVGVAVNKFLPFMQFGRNKEITQVAETFLDIQRQARLAKEDIDLAIEGYSGLTEAQKQQLQENEKATRLKGTELQVASATGLDTTQLKADLEGLRQKREEILNTIQGYDQLVAASNRVDSAIENLNTRLENEQIDRQTYNEELARLTEQKQRVTVLLDDYAEGTKQITNNVRALASELQKVSVEFQNAQLNAERTASMAQMELIKGRLSGKVSAPEFARQQTAIVNQQTTATKDAAISARDAALKSIQSIDNTMLGLELEAAFGDQLKTVLSNGTVEAVEAARERLSQGGKELDPAIETALNSIQEYIGLRNQAFELEKQTLEQQLDNRQQAADILQQEIDLLNERAQFEIDTKSLQAEIEQMRQMGTGMLSEFQAQQLSATQEATAKRQDAARLRASASEAQFAAQNPNILPEARQRFLRDAQRQNLEAQLKDQEALYAESQARIARELRPLDLAKEQIDINLNAAQQQASVQMNQAMASSALSSFQKEMMQGGSAINQLLFEAQNESFLAQMERGKAGIAGLSPDKRKELLISAQQRENLAEQKRSEAELQQVELQRNKQIRDFEMATKQAAIANDQFYQSRKNAILSEQANAKTVGDIATANIIAQKKQLDLEIEYTKRKLALNQQQLASNENLYRRGIIDIDTYNENYSQLTTERLNLQESVTNQQIQLNQQEIENFQKLADQLKSVNTIREAVLEAQIKGQERATLATNVYSDALSKQGDLIQAQSKIRANGANKAILDAELAVSALNKQTEAEIAILNQKKESATEAEKARIDAEIAKKEADTKAKVEQKSLEIAQEKARLLEQEQATQRKLLALEIERNKITAQQQIKEAEIGALRARNAVVAAQIAVKEKAATGDPVELLQAQLGLELATEEFRVALGQIDINKQNAVITNQLAALQREGLLGEQNIERARQAGDFALQFGSASNPFNFGDGGFGFALDPSVKALANMGNSLATVTDFSKYDALLSQLNRAAQPLEAQLSTQTNAIKATNDLTGAITSLNEKITGLVTTLGRPNISVSGGSSISDAVELMRMTK